MLIFIVPLQSPEASRDWAHVSRLAIRTLHSACRQESDDFRVILVCNRPPIGLFEHPALTVIEENFPLPGADPDDRMRDKWKKVQRGLIATRDLAPAHFLCMDADDCVHRGLATLSKQEPATAGWIFDIGYVRDEGNRWVYRWPEFNRYCGTSSIVRCTADDLPASMHDPDECCPMLEFGHTRIDEGMRQRGTPLTSLPFIGTVYNTDTGENFSQIALRRWRGKKMLVKKLFGARPVTAALRESFGLYELA